MTEASGRRFVIVDVFVEDRFGGNPLAVIPDAEGLSVDDMQRIAREFNFSETTFVMPTNAAGADFHVRIFTPTQEVPFAGHPNVGTAFVLLAEGLLDGNILPQSVCFEEAAGLVPVSLTTNLDGAVYAELRAPETLTIGPQVDTALVARILGLSERDIETQVHGPQVASVGLPFLLVELSGMQALEQVVVDVSAMRELAATGITSDIHCYVRAGDGTTLRTRMFAPLDGVPEDPATGSANCALAALLTALRSEDQISMQFDIRQGVEMGRPSRLWARTRKQAGDVTGVWIGGVSRQFAAGELGAH